MRVLLHAAPLLLLSLVVVAASTKPARAAGLVLGQAPASVRIALARGAGGAADRTSRWYSVSSDASAAGPMLWLVPIGRGAAVDFTSGAWLEALDEVTAPRIRSSCRVGPTEVVRMIEPGAAAASGPASLELLTTREALDAALADWSVTPDEHAALLTYMATRDLAAVKVTAPTSVTLRVVDREPSLSLPMSLTRGSSVRGVDVTVMVIGESRAWLGAGGGTEVGPLEWLGAKSDYRDRREGALAAAGPGAMITESAQTGTVLDASITLPSLASAYFARAAAYGDLSDTAAFCTQRAATSDEGASDVPQCARAERAGSALLPCASITPLGCGPVADELALAMSELVAKSAWITRFVGNVAPGSAWSDAVVSVSPGPPVSQFLVATDTCDDPSESSSPASSGGNRGGSSSSGQSSPPSFSSNSTSSSSSSSGTDVVVVAGGGGCGGSSDAASSGDDCSGDTSSSDESSGSSSSSGDDCSSDDSTKSSSDACSVCAVQSRVREPDRGTRSRHSRSPMSRLLMVGALIVLPLRRRTRRAPPA